MAERRPLTARDIKSNVEGYQEMSDEAFARRFYSDRAELVALGVPLDSQRDEFTGEELYTLRSERYFLPRARARRRRARRAPDLPLPARGPLRLRGAAAARAAEPRARPLGRALAAAPTATAVRVEVRDPDYSPELQGRLGKLEGAISKQRTVKFRYWSIDRDDEGERTLNPYALLPENGTWYVIGHDLDATTSGRFRVSRIRSDIRFATRRERDFRAPAGVRRRGLPRPRRMAVRRHRRRGADRGRARHGLVGRARLRRRRATGSRTTSSSPSTRRCRCSRAGSCARTGAPSRSSRPALRRLVAEGARAARARARGRAADACRRAAVAAASDRPPSGPRARSRRSASASCSRCSPTCSPPAATSARR